MMLSKLKRSDSFRLIKMTRWPSVATLVFMAMLSSAVQQVVAQTKKPVEPPKPIFADKTGRLNYTPDSLGNRIIDFSYAGYRAGQDIIPSVPNKAFVPLVNGDATECIQRAIDYVSTLPKDKNGFRGAILLAKGTYQVAGSLMMRTSGIVLRGSGMEKGGTLIYGTGVERIGLIRVIGKADKKLEKQIQINDGFVPVNAMKIEVSSSSDFKVGDEIMITRPSTKNWIEAIGTDHFGGGITSLGWKPNQRDLFWDRKVVGIAGNQLQLDAPLTTALDRQFGGSTVAKFSWPGRIEEVGIENIRLQSAFDKSNIKDEYHRWNAINIENAINVWVRNITFEHFAGSAVLVQESAKQVTVQDCKSLNPISEIAGERRNTFFTLGQQTLFQRLYAEYGMHDFAVGFCATGPNAFVQCQSYLPFGFSGTIDSWASGVLFDIVNIDGQALSFLNRGQDGQGAGWSAANSVFWQCSAARVDNFSPPTARNWAFGTWAQFAGNGYWDMSNEQIQPRSLYYAQLSDRIGDAAKLRTILMPVETEASSSPPVDVALKLTILAQNPAQTLYQFIDKQIFDPQLLKVDQQVKIIDALSPIKKDAVEKVNPLKLENGWLIRANRWVGGGRQDVQWWNGSARPYGLLNAKAHITRFVPGREGKGLTDNLETMTDDMLLQSRPILDHNYGLWYDRRRDDHERIRRMDGEVWAPFYELPFARSGVDKAWDGLSKYDLTKYNPWYWDRLKQFANLADQKGLILFHQNYFQHNIIEAGAHYADFPWRTANNINNTGFPEPVPYAGDKRIFMAEQFYDISNPQRRKIHAAYIRKCLSNFAGNYGVIQFIGAEFTGPLHFVQFWIDTIKAWEKETGKHPLIALSVTKDVQDAILADPARASVIDIIDIRYWHYQENGEAYAPKGGENLAPRQHARLLKPKKTSFEQVYRAVSEYKSKYPSKAVIYSGDNADSFGWAVLMAGGSLANVNSEILPADVSQLQPAKFKTKSKQYALENSGKTYLIYNASDLAADIDLKGIQGSFKIEILNPKNGSVLKSEIAKGGTLLTINKISSQDELLKIEKINQ